MTYVPGLPYAGPPIIDLSGMMGFLYDVAPGAMRGIKREQEGLPVVAGELAANFGAYGAEIGLSPAVYDRFLLYTSQIEQIRAARTIVDKMAEVLAESEAKLEDEREAEIGIIATAARAAAKRKDASLMAPFENTVRYHGQVQLRGAKTRRKNAEAAAEAEAEAEMEAEAEAAAR